MLRAFLAAGVHSARPGGLRRERRRGVDSGPALGAVIIGLAEQIGLAYFPTYAIVLTFLIMVVVPAVRPQGLLAGS